MKVALLMMIFSSTSFSKLQKGFHFNPRRTMDYQIPVEDMVKHIDDEKSDWHFKFKEYGNCVRADVKPFKMPNKLTFCWKHNQEFKDSMNFINLIGTSDGRSIVDAFNDTSWRKMRGEHVMLNFLMLHRNYYGSLWHMVHDKNGESNGLGPQEGHGYTWYEWEHWCVAINFEIGQAVSYVNGYKDGDTVQGDGFWRSPLQEAISKSHEGKGMVTDVLFGCNFWNIKGPYTSFRSMGKMTDMHLFDKLLTVEEMINMTTCGGKKQQGNLINFDSDSFEVFGKNSREITISSEEWCPERNFSATFFGAPWHFSNAKGMNTCKKVKRRLIAITDESILDHFLFFTRYMNNSVNFIGWMPSAVVRNSEGKWLEPYTGKDSILPWYDSNNPKPEGVGADYVFIMYNVKDG